MVEKFSTIFAISPWPLAISFFSFANSHPYHGAKIIGGAPAVLDRRRAMPSIGGAVCNCLIGVR